MLLERMNNDEFREYLPHMDLDELLCTEICKNVKWTELIHISTRKKDVTCLGCDVSVVPEAVREHLRSAAHLEAMKKVSQFYHPAYTYFRGAKDLMKGKKVSTRELHRAIEVANGGISKLKEALASNKGKILPKPDTENIIESPEYQEALQKLVLSTTPRDPQVIYAVAHIPLLTLLALEYSVEENIWKRMVTSDSPNINAVFQCELCNVTCRKIKALNYHFSSSAHLKNQYNTLGVRSKIYDYLTKNCAYRFNAMFSFYINKAGKWHFQQDVEKIFKQKNGGKSNDEPYEGNKEIPEMSNALKDKVNALRQQIEEFDSKDSNDELDNTGLIGVEYVVRIVHPLDASKNEYECVLCESVGNELRMAEHLVTLTHRLRYMELHYPDTMMRYKDNMGHMKYPRFIRVVSLILAKLAKALEQYHGYGTVRDIPYALYNQTRAQVVSEIYSQPHASHEYGPSFSNVVSLSEIRSFIANSELSIMDNVEHSVPERFTAASPKNYDDCVGPVKDRKPTARSARSRSASRKRGYSPRSPRRSRPRDSTYDSQRADIWKRYRHEVSKAAIGVENKYVEYRKQPETHPQYNEEWNGFWKRRKEELIAQGIDHRGYNFQPEWVNYFKKRIEVFFGEALQLAQIEIRRRLNIPLDAEEDAPTDRYEKQRRRDVSPTAPLPWTGPVNGASYNSSVPTVPQVSAVMPVAPPFVDNKPNVIHVLRLLSALEDHLGSLGSKIMELMAKALAMEKHFGDNYIALERKIMSGDNCTLIETALEKLKGVLFAGLLDATKEQSFKRVLQSTENLLRHADRLGYRNVLSIDEEEPAHRAGIAANNSNLTTLWRAVQNQNVQSGTDAQKSLSDTLMALIASGRSGGANQRNGGANNQQVTDNNMNNKQHVGNTSMQPRSGAAGSYPQQTMQHNGAQNYKNNQNFGSNGNWMGFSSYDGSAGKSSNANYNGKNVGYPSKSSTGNQNRYSVQQVSGTGNGQGAKQQPGGNNEIWRRYTNVNQYQRPQ